MAIGWLTPSSAEPFSEEEYDQYMQVWLIPASADNLLEELVAWGGFSSEEEAIRWLEEQEKS